MLELFSIQVWFNDKWEINAESMKEENAKNSWNNLLLLEKYGFTRPARLISNVKGIVETFDPLRKLSYEIMRDDKCFKQT